MPSSYHEKEAVRLVSAKLCLATPNENACIIVTSVVGLDVDVADILLLSRRVRMLLEGD